MNTFNFLTQKTAFVSSNTNPPAHRIRVVIIEHSADAQAALSSILREYCPSIHLAGIAKGIIDGIRLIENHKPDLIFLNTEIDGGTSFDLLDRISYRHFKIIFTTNLDQYALKAFKYGAIDCLVKPYGPKDVLHALERVRRMLYDQAIFNRLDFLIKNTNGSFIKKISIPTSDGVSLVAVNDIVRLEADRSYCFIWLSDGERILVSKPLKEFESNLPSESFFRVHTSHLINLEYIKKYVKEDGGYILMNDGSSIPIARRRKQAFLELLIG